MSDSSVLERLDEGKVTKDDVIYLAQREGLPGIPPVAEVVDVDQAELEEALYSNEGFAKKRKAKAKAKPKASAADDDDDDDDDEDDGKDSKDSPPAT